MILVWYLYDIFIIYRIYDIWPIYDRYSTTRYVYNKCKMCVIFVPDFLHLYYTYQVPDMYSVVTYHTHIPYISNIYRVPDICPIMSILTSAILWTNVHYLPCWSIISLLKCTHYVTCLNVNLFLIKIKWIIKNL